MGRICGTVMTRVKMDMTPTRRRSIVSERELIPAGVVQSGGMVISVDGHLWRRPTLCLFNLTGNPKRVLRFRATYLSRIMDYPNHWGHLADSADGSIGSHPADGHSPKVIAVPRASREARF